MEEFHQSFWFFWSSVLNSVLRCAPWCLQAEGGKKAEAVATVVAAVDHARVRLPVAEEEETLQAEVRQQAREITTEKVVQTKKLPAELPLPPVVSVVSEQLGVQVTQVG